MTSVRNKESVKRASSFHNWFRLAICNEDSIVAREDCSCRGNVIKIEEGYEIEKGYGRCLTCGSDW
jgi:hypothetical protein